MNDYPSRKNMRLSDFDYAQNGSYFITICVEDRHEMLGQIVGAGSTRPHINYSEYGKIVNRWIEILPSRYSQLVVNNYVIMPNHVHLLLSIKNGFNPETNGRVDPAPTSHTVSQIIGFFKYQTTKEIEIRDFWQRSFHDHIIRDYNDYWNKYQYISDNLLN